MKYLAFVLLCVGIVAQGQTQQTLIASKPLPENVRLSCVIHSGVLTCDIPVVPVVADGAETVKPYVCPLGQTCRCEDHPESCTTGAWPTKRADGSACTSNDLVGASAANATGYVCIPPPEPADVPAIQKKRKECVARASITSSCFGDPADGPCGCGFYQADVDYWTCADALRVLEHDESVPAHYTCRRIEK